VGAHRLPGPAGLGSGPLAYHSPAQYAHIDPLADAHRRGTHHRHPDTDGDRHLRVAGNPDPYLHRRADGHGHYDAGCSAFADADGRQHPRPNLNPYPADRDPNAGSQ
jgi:hypothetical protein